MATLETGERHQELLDELLAELDRYETPVDRELVTRAFRFAAAAHEGQQRQSGHDFIEHPVGAAKVCAELRLDDQTVAAALLHDVVEEQRRRAMSSPNSARTSSMSVPVSSTTSWSSAAATVWSSRRSSAHTFAAPTGCSMKSWPDCRCCPSWAAAAKRK